MGILLSLAIPKFGDYQESSCITKLQLQVFNFKLALKNQHNKIDLPVLYETLDLKPSHCYFEIQNDGFIGINGNRKIYFVINEGILECDFTKSANLHNGESLCDVF